MAEQLNVSKYNPTFNDKISCKEVNDFKKTTSDCFKLTGKYFRTLRNISAASTTLATEQLFTIPKELGHVSHFYVEFIGSNPGTHAIGNWMAANVISSIKIEQGDQTLMQYTGQDLVKMLHLVNRDKNVKTELAAIANGNTTISSSYGDPSASPLIIPLIAPGSNGVHTLDSSDIRNPAWPIGAANTPMTIRITTRTGAQIAGSSNTAYALTTFKLKFFSYAVDNSGVYNLQPSSSGIYYTWNYFRTISNIYSRAHAATDSFTIDNVITQGELVGITVSVNGATENTGTSIGYLYNKSTSLTALSLTMNGEKIYEHSNVVEAQLRCLADWKVKNQIEGDDGNSYIYPMALTCRPDLSLMNIGTNGINLNNNKPTIDVTNGTSDTTAYFHLMAIYKCLYNIKNDKNVEYKISV